MSKVSIKRNFLYNAAYQVVKIITPLIAMPYLSRVLGADQLGVYSYTYSIAQYFVLFGVLGMSTYGVRLVAQAQDDRAERSRLFWSAFFSQGVVSTLALVAYVAYVAFFAREHGALSLLWGFWVLSCALDVSWLYFGVEDFKRTTIRSVLIKVIDLVLIFTFVRSKTDLWLYVLIESLNYLVSQLVLWPFLHEYVDWHRPSRSEVASHLRPSLALFIPVVAISLYTTLNRVLLGNLSTMEQTAYYDYASRMCVIPGAIVTAFGTVMLPRMSSEFALGRKEDALRLIQLSVWVMLLGAFALSFGIVGISEEFVPVFFGSGFDAVKEPLLVICWEVPLICCSNVIGRQYLLPNNRDRDYTISICCGAALNIIVCVMLIPSMGSVGAAIGTIIAELTVLAVQVILTRDELPFARYVLRCLPFLLIAAIMALVMRMASPFFRALFGPSVPLLVAEFVLGALVYAGLSLAYCIVFKSPEYARVFGRRQNLSVDNQA